MANLSSIFYKKKNLNKKKNCVSYEDSFLNNGNVSWFWFWFWFLSLQ